ncbi:hypothetical protein [Pararhizobium sp.]|uniref:hypothetical protein n=1 Tax=Pararhizobium sp. TaxID=1977563 RepID=UPI0027230FF6|nr:hypothetical protein [Pararhizobium sp.]MDO9414690.1 hypothetical protein [Pararhizobium sp.]
MFRYNLEMIKAAVLFAVISGVMVVDTYANNGHYSAKAWYAFSRSATDLLYAMDDLRKEYL